MRMTDENRLTCRRRCRSGFEIIRAALHVGERMRAMALKKADRINVE